MISLKYITEEVHFVKKYSPLNLFDVKLMTFLFRAKKGLDLISEFIRTLNDAAAIKLCEHIS